MQFPEIKQSTIIEILNMFGLGLLGTGMIVLYRALISRTNLLSKGLDEIEKAYKFVLDMMDKRATLIDKRFEDELSFRTIYLNHFKDSEMITKSEHDRITLLLEEVDSLNRQLIKAKEDLGIATEENCDLKVVLIKIEGAHRALLRKVQELSPPPPPNVKGLY